MTAYFVAPDGFGDPALWREDPTGGAAHQSVLARYELDDDTAFLWPILVGVLTEDDEVAERVKAALRDALITVGADPDEALMNGLITTVEHLTSVALRAIRGGAS